MSCGQFSQFISAGGWITLYFKFPSWTYFLQFLQFPLLFHGYQSVSCKHIRLGGLLCHVPHTSIGVLGTSDLPLFIQLQPSHLIYLYKQLASDATTFPCLAMLWVLLVPGCCLRAAVQHSEMRWHFCLVMSPGLQWQQKGEIGCFLSLRSCLFQWIKDDYSLSWLIDWLIHSPKHGYLRQAKERLE